MAVAPAAEQVATPYWATIVKDIARMRKGPSPDMPVIWEYRRKGLPVKVLAVHENWRKVQDPDGAVGWMNARLLARRQSGLVVGARLMMRESTDDNAAVLYIAQPGVVGTLSDCTGGWCHFDVNGKAGWIRAAGVWGSQQP